MAEIGSKTRLSGQAFAGISLAKIVLGGQQLRSYICQVPIAEARKSVRGDGFRRVATSDAHVGEFAIVPIVQSAFGGQEPAKSPVKPTLSMILA